MKEIVLYRNKGIVLVDDEDFEWLSQHRWHLDHGYASMTIKKPKPYRGKCIYLGSFADKQKAAHAYSVAAQKYYGEFTNVDLC